MWVLGVQGNLAIKRDEKGGLLILFGTALAKKLFNIYRKRWGIETFFQSIKKRGFNLEDTHVKEIKKLKKLFAIVCLSYCFCVGVGVEYHKKVQFMKKQNDGYKRNSFFRKELDIIKKAIKREKRNKTENKECHSKTKFNPLVFLNQLLDDILQKKT